jgi:DNA-binding CsgD family transcriptional regulator
VSCTTPQGAGGRGFSVRVTLAGAGYTMVSNVYSGTPLQFAEPVIAGFSGPGAIEGATAGGVQVLMDGDNFGFDPALLNVSYTLALKDEVPLVTRKLTNTTFTPSSVTYVPASCSLAVPHRRLACTTTAGAGAALNWRVVVNNISNVAPTTSYAAPAITTLTVVGAVGGLAATDGGQVLRIAGTGFGVSNLVPNANGAVRLLQRVSLVSRGGVLNPVNWSAVTLVSDARLDLVIPPGSGAGWRVQVRVADRDSPISVATFSYAQPRVNRIDCYGPLSGVTSGLAYRGKPAGGFPCTVFAANLPLNDPDSEIGVLFGNSADGSLSPTALRAAVGDIQRFPSGRHLASWLGLTAREYEVASLIASGHTNREIAEALVLGERTIETHVSNMLGKLGLESRREVARWFTDTARG